MGTSSDAIRPSGVHADDALKAAIVAAVEAGMWDRARSLIDVAATAPKRPTGGVVRLEDRRRRE